ncbi:MAG TPA: hypothetical protein VNG51_02830 [Ktedonobacteraceae bacterium]|nr:hypothetical protein [Ktedonobacteraceae bacterium]
MDIAVEQILALLTRVSLTPAEQFIEKYPHQLSGGQRQSVAITRFRKLLSSRLNRRFCF